MTTAKTTTKPTTKPTSRTATAEPKSTVRCAIYTRKSSEEGLEQSFNSLDAQREACEAFVVSQRQEGWRALPALYDDGGFSGGNMDRPALKRLLEDIEAHKVDTIVVYKVDRLTRSLADFAKIVEALDARGVSFVSVTQQFNTTSSMGRLTLNVLLSFAQFEREVTGERIRDKIAASKRKGMWMGGPVPLGYSLKERKLIVNPKESEFIRRLFRLYLELGSVSQLKLWLDKEKIRTKIRISALGKRSGGTAYSRGGLYKLLENKHYLGVIRHRELCHEGEHEAIVPRELWDKVAAKLQSDNQGRRNGLAAGATSLLVGLVWDSNGTQFTPSHTLKNGRRYRYYVGRPNQDGSQPAQKPIRIAAQELEKLVCLRLQTFLRSPRNVLDEVGVTDNTANNLQQTLARAVTLSEDCLSLRPEQRGFVREVIRRIVVNSNKIEVQLSRKRLSGLLHILDPVPMNSRDSRRSHPTPISNDTETQNDIIRLEIEAQVQRCGMEMRLVVAPRGENFIDSKPVPSLLKAVARGHQWMEWIRAGEVSDQRSIAHRLGLTERYVARVLECAYLAPDIIEAILDGRQPSNISFQKLTRRLPMSWTAQREILG
jgi:site-specific DNA recombinase